jgi:EmrB/QacA subfamily drug resistance transporter
MSASSAVSSPVSGPATIPASPPARGFTHQQIKQVVFGILLCIFLAAVDQTVVIPAVPAIAADLRGFGHLSWIVSAYLLTATAATPIFGRLSDIYGRRKLLMQALVVFGVASCLCALSQNLWQLIAARALQGIGGAGLMAMAQAAIADVVSPRERGRYQGFMASTWGVACIAGPIFGGWLTDHASWRWIFWINVPLCAVALVMCDRALRVLITVPRPSRIDYMGGFLLTAAVTCLLLIMSWGGTTFPWLSAPVMGLAILAAVMLAVLVPWERKVADPLLPPRLFQNKVILAGIGLGFFSAVALFGGTFLLPLFFQLVRGVDASSSGLLVVPFLGFNCVGAFTAGQIARRLGRTRGLLIFGYGGTVIGFLLLATLSAHTGMLALVAYQGFLGYMIGLVMPTTLVAVQNAAETRDVGVATGVLLFLRSMGGAVGSTLVGAILVMGFSGTIAALGLNLHIDMSELRGHDPAMDALSPANAALLKQGLTHAFHLAFWVCGGLLMIALAICLMMRDLPLRSHSAAEPAPLAH